jgi:flagellar secretion chaperone FliS
MRNNRYLDNLDHEILTADPVRLIQLLYRGALDSITSARRHLKLGDIRARSRAISKAMAIVTELALSLDHGSGGELSKNLAELYAYAEKLLIQANIEQSDPPLAEAERLLATLLEAWQNCNASESRAGDSTASTSQGSPYQPVSCAY